MKRTVLLASGFIPPIAPPLPRLDANGFVKPGRHNKKSKEPNSGDMRAIESAEYRRAKRRIKGFVVDAKQRGGPVINLGDLLRETQARLVAEGDQL